MRDKPHRALWNQQRPKRRLEHRFRIVKQLPFHFARRRLKNRTKQVGFYRLFNFHLHPAFEHLNTTSLTLTYMAILTPDYNNQLLWAREYNPSNAYIDMVILTSDDNRTAFPPPPPGRHTSIHGLWSFQLMSTPSFQLMSKPIWVHPRALWKFLIPSSTQYFCRYTFHLWISFT